MHSSANVPTEEKMELSKYGQLIRRKQRLKYLKYKQTIDLMNKESLSLEKLGD